MKNEKIKILVEFDKKILKEELQEICPLNSQGEDWLYKYGQALEDNIVLDFFSIKQKKEYIKIIKEKFKKYNPTFVEITNGF